MSRITLSLLGLILSFSVLAQGYNPKTWKEVAQSVAEGNEQAAFFLVKSKAEIEALPQWDNKAKDLYIGIIDLLVSFTSNKGWYQDEETAIIDAIRNFNEKEADANSPYKRRLWIYMTKLHKDLGNADEILNYGQKALYMFEEVQDYGYYYYMLLHNIALGYIMKKDLLSAKLYADEAVAGIETLARNNLITAEMTLPFYNSLGMIEQELGNFDSAIEIFNRIINTSSPETLGSFYWFDVNNLSTLYLKKGDYTKGKEVLTTIKDDISPELTSAKYQNLILANYFNGDEHDILEAFQAHNKNQFLIAYNVVRAFSEAEREEYFKTWGTEMMFINNLVANKYPHATNDAFEANIVARNIEMSVNLSLKEIVKSDSTGVARALKQAREDIIQKEIPQEKRDSLHRIVIEKEKELLRTSSELSTKIDEHIGDVTNIANQLSGHEAIVQFTYIPEMPSMTKLNPFYGAYVILPQDSVVHLVKLCGVDEVEDIFFNSHPTTEFISDLYGDEKGSKLYEMLWAPIMDLLHDKYTIYYAIAGPLGQLNHEALITDSGERFGFTKDMRLVSNTTELANASNHRILVNGKEIALFGSPNYNTSVKNMATKAEAYSLFSGEDISNNLALRGELLRDGWSLLPGTKAEINDIASALKAKRPSKIQSFVDDNATEEAVKGLSGKSPAILHFATHGFVISTQNQYDESHFAQSMSGLSGENRYMLWTGLVLAGGNNTWKGLKIPDGVEDGILTADEISRLDFSNTDLVVLSACETGRGHINPITGIWGLQRAFKLAGVKSILMTLWKIPDATTATFMGEFYRQLAEGVSPRQSLRKAQQYLIDNGAADPFYWAPFIILD